MKAFRGMALCLTIGAVAVPMASQPVSAQDSKVTLIEMSPNELAENGVALRELRMRPFPNSCRQAGNAGLSVSDQMLEHFRAQGFSLESLCLGLSGAIHFDPETGRQLPIAHVRVPGKGEYLDVPLNLPRCFRDAVPELECEFRFDAWIKYRLKPSQIPTEFARKFNVEVRGYIEQIGFPESSTSRISGVEPLPAPISGFWRRRRCGAAMGMRWPVPRAMIPTPRPPIRQPTKKMATPARFGITHSNRFSATPALARRR